ncbi:DUF4229 domain-containing protein [Antribacter gilvus]|uniref:DUF4229 domain-containing protein n=1 Tax=Antribacter gilvus TaxID=2304675 RepID=UPI000F773660|nr:DUF4229 domain-containing protein [Antribacter gilvus]
MPLLVYSLLRVGLFAVLVLALYWVGLRDWLLVLVAAVLAFALSYLLLRGPRDASARWLAERSGRAAAGDPAARGFTREAVDDADVEDAAVDARLRDDDPRTS